MKKKVTFEITKPWLNESTEVVGVRWISETHPTLEFAIAKDNGCFGVYEISSGAKVSDNVASRKSAIKTATANLAGRTLKQMKELIDSWIKSTT